MNAGMQCRVATSFSIVVSDFTGFSSDYFQRKVCSFQTKLSVAIMGHMTQNQKSISVVTTWLISAHVCRAQVIYTVVIVQVNVQAYADTGI